MPSSFLARSSPPVAWQSNSARACGPTGSSGYSTRGPSKIWSVARSPGREFAATYARTASKRCASPRPRSPPGAPSCSWSERIAPCLPGPISQTCACRRFGFSQFTHWLLRRSPCSSLPVRVGARYYADGGLRLNTPLAPAVRLGANRILVIGLSRLDPRAARREPCTRTCRRFRKPDVPLRQGAQFSFAQPH